MVLNLALCCGAIWRRRENRNMGEQLRSFGCTTASKIFWKIYFLYDFWCAQTCSFRTIFELLKRNLTILLPALYSDVHKKLYRCTSAFLALRYCDGFLKKISRLSIRSCAHKLFRRFLDFLQFLTAILRKLWRHLATKMWTLLHLKGQPVFKNKTVKTTSKSTHKPWHNTCSKYVPVERRACRTWSVTDKKINW